MGNYVWTMRAALKQALACYMQLMHEAKHNEDAQGENFWASHAETVRCVLDEVELCDACEKKAAR